MRFLQTLTCCLLLVLTMSCSSTRPNTGPRLYDGGKLDSEEVVVLVNPKGVDIVEITRLDPSQELWSGGPVKRMELEVLPGRYKIQFSGLKKRTSTGTYESKESAWLERDFEAGKVYALVLHLDPNDDTKYAHPLNRAKTKDTVVGSWEPEWVTLSPTSVWFSTRVRPKKTKSTYP